MPFYEYKCSAGHRQTLYFSMSEHQSYVRCVCGEEAQQIITAPAMISVQPNIAYDSPIDGTIISSWNARNEDLKRHGCQPYDPAMRQEADARIKQADAELDRAIDDTVEEEIHKMPTAKRAMLASELTEQGVGVEYVRRSP